MIIKIISNKFLQNIAMKITISKKNIKYRENYYLVLAICINYLNLMI